MSILGIQAPRDDADAAANSLVAAVGYLWILCLVPLLLRERSPFAQFHGRQGFALFATSIGLWILGWLPVIGWVVWGAGAALLAFLSAVGVVAALRGRRWELPLLGPYAQKIQF